MRKPIYFAALLSALLLSACSRTSPSSVSNSVSVTDESGNTAEKSDSVSVDSSVSIDPSNGVTATVEVSGGAEESTEEETESTEEETETSEAEAEETEAADDGGQKAYLMNTYEIAGASEDEDGTSYYMLFDNGSIGRAFLMYLFPDRVSSTFVEGEVTREGDEFTIHDIQEDYALTFTIQEIRDDSMDITFEGTDEMITLSFYETGAVADRIIDILANTEILTLEDTTAE